MKQLVRQREDEIQLLPSTLKIVIFFLFIRLQRLRHRPRLLLRRRLRLEGGRCFRRPEGLRPDLRRQWPRHCCSRSGQITNIVVPGFKALGPSTALSALNPGSAQNPGTNSLSNKEIVCKLKVDLNNTISLKKTQMNWRKLNKVSTNAKIITKIAYFKV